MSADYSINIKNKTIMELKVGDKVRIKSKEWYNANKDEDGHIFSCGVVFTPMKAEYCGQEATITYVDNDNTCHIDIDKYNNWWTEAMFEPAAEKESVTPDKESIIKDIAEIIRNHNIGVIVSEQDGKLIIEPIKEDDDLPIDTPCMVSDLKANWSLRYYSGNNKVYSYLSKSERVHYRYIIPFDKFDPNNIEESLKYNIAR